MSVRSIHQHEREQRAYFDDALGRFSDRLGPADGTARILGQAMSSCLARVLHRFDSAWDDAQDAILAATDPRPLSVIPARRVVMLASGRGPRVVRRNATLWPVGAAGREDARPEFRTTREATAWPVAVTDLILDGADVRFRITSTDADPEARLGDLVGLDRLPLYVAADLDQAVAIHHALSAATNATAGLEGRPLGLRALGLDPAEAGTFGGLLPSTHGIPEAERQLAEFLLFPESFLFVELTGLAEALRGADRTIDVAVRVDGTPSRRTGQARSVQLLTNCVPVVNLFEDSCSVAIRPHRDAHRVAPRGGESLEVARILGVTERGAPLSPLHAVGHPYETAPEPRTYWQALERPSADGGSTASESSLRLIDRGPKSAVSADRKVHVRLMSCNGDDACRRPIDQWKVEADGLGARSVSPMHPPLRPPTSDLSLRGAAHRIAGQNALRRLGTIPPSEGAAALRGLLRHRGLFDWAASTSLAAEADRLRGGLARMIEAIVAVEARRDPRSPAGRPRRLVSIRTRPAGASLPGSTLPLPFLRHLFTAGDPFGLANRVEIVADLTSENSNKDTN